MFLCLRKILDLVSLFLCNVYRLCLCCVVSPVSTNLHTITGYPIYVSPLTTSYAGTNTQLTSTFSLLSEVSLRRVKNFFISLWDNLMELPCALSCMLISHRRERNRRQMYVLNRHQGSRSGGDALSSHPTVGMLFPVVLSCASLLMECIWAIQ